jgi:hypothetical protein
MKSLTSTLLAAQKKARAKPYVRVRIFDMIGVHSRYTWAQLSSDGTDDYPCAACVAGDDSIVRMKVVSGTVYRQRITDPTVGSQWTTWTNTGWTVHSENQVWLCCNGDANVYFYYITSSGLSVGERISTDYGATFGTSSNVYTASGADRIESVCAAFQDTGYPIVFFSCGDPASSTGDVDLFETKKSGGGWSTPTSWSAASRLQIRGMTVYRDGSTDYLIMFGGSLYDATTTLAWWELDSVVYGCGVDVAANTWSSVTTVEATDKGTAFAYAWPSLTYTDTMRGIFSWYKAGGTEYAHVVAMRKVTGSTFLSGHWTSPMPLQAEGAPYGMLLCYKSGGDGYIYAICSNAAYRAEVSGASSVSFTDRVKRYRLVDRWTGRKGAGLAMDVSGRISPDLGGEVWLEDFDGELNTLGSGTYEVIKRGSCVLVDRGYVTTAGNEYSTWTHLWIEDYEHVVDFKGRCYLVLYLIGPWGILNSMASHRQYHWPADGKTSWQQLSRIFALAGHELLNGGEASSRVGSLKPSFVISPGEDLRGGTLRALAKVPDFIYFQNGDAYAKELSASEGSDYTYGGVGNHVIQAGRYGVRSPAVNYVEVFGAYGSGAWPSWGDDVDWDEVALIGTRLQKVFDYSYDSDSECENRAADQLRIHQTSAALGEIVTLPNVGLQLFDVVTVNDDRAGISSQLYRVRGIVEEYDETKERLIYRQKVTLGAR